MRASRRRAAIGLLAAVVIAGVVVSARHFAERNAIDRVLSAGGTVAFESSGEELAATGAYTLFSRDDRQPVLDLLINWFPRKKAGPNTRAASRPSGSVRVVDLPSDSAVRAVVENRYWFRQLDDLVLGEGVGSAAAMTLIAAVAAGDIQVKGINCYASFESEEQIEALVGLPIESLLVGSPGLETTKLTGLERSETLRSLWLNELKDSGVEIESRIRPDRYAPPVFRRIAECKSLREVFLIGFVITDPMAVELSKATQLTTLRISRSRLSREAEETIRSGLGVTAVQIKRASDSGEKEGNDELVR